MLISFIKRMKKMREKFIKNCEGEEKKKNKRKLDTSGTPSMGGQYRGFEN